MFRQRPQKTVPGTTLPSSQIYWPQAVPLTRSLKIECHHLGATQPETEGIVVGGVHPLSLRVNAGQSLLIVLQEIDGFLPDDAVSLRLHKGTDFSEVGIFCTKRQSPFTVCLVHFMNEVEAYKTKPGSSLTRHARGPDATAIIGTAVAPALQGS